jgi:integrase
VYRPEDHDDRGVDRREGVPINVIQRQLGHANLGMTSTYLQGIDSGEIIETVRTAAHQ